MHSRKREQTYEKGETLITPEVPTNHSYYEKKRDCLVVEDAPIRKTWNLFALGKKSNQLLLHLPVASARPTAKKDLIKKEVLSPDIADAFKGK